MRFSIALCVVCCLSLYTTPHAHQRCHSSFLFQLCLSASLQLPHSNMAYQQPLNPELIAGYQPMPLNLVLPFTEWGSSISRTCPDKHGLVWHLKNSYPPRSYERIQEKAAPGHPIVPAKRDRASDARKPCLWVFQYECHRSGHEKSNQN